MSIYKMEKNKGNNLIIHLAGIYSHGNLFYMTVLTANDIIDLFKTHYYVTIQKL